MVGKVTGETFPPHPRERGCCEAAVPVEDYVLRLFASLEQLLERIFLVPKR